MDIDFSYDFNVYLGWYDVNNDKITIFLETVKHYLEEIEPPITEDRLIKLIIREIIELSLYKVFLESD